MNIKSLAILLLALFVLGCSKQPQESTSSETVNSPVASNVNESSREFTIGPFNAQASSVITLQTDDNSLGGSNIHWYVNDMKDESSRGIRFSSNALKKGDTVKAVIRKGKDEYESNEILISNSPPTIVKARLLPSPPVSTSRLTVEAVADDKDNDYISYTYNWTWNGRFAGEESSLEEEFKRGDEITVTVTPMDKEDRGNSVTLNTTIVNSIPEVSEGPQEFDGTLYSYQITATDPDGDALSYALEEGPEGMTVDTSSGLITWEAGQDDAGIYDFKVSVSDGHGAKILIPLTTVISAQ